jgi:molybdopterin converting factor small subunit
MKNPDLLKEVVPTESELKEIIVNYVGKTINPENDEITVEDIVDVFAQQFPEFLLALAEENWVNGYTQALSDSNAAQHALEVPKVDNTTVHKG